MKFSVWSKWTINKISRPWSRNAVAAPSAEKRSPVFEILWRKCAPSPVLYNRLWLRNIWNLNCPLNTIDGAPHPEKIGHPKWIYVPLLVSQIPSSSHRGLVNLRKMSAVYLQQEEVYQYEIYQYWLWYNVLNWSQRLRVDWICFNTLDFSC